MTTYTMPIKQTSASGNISIVTGGSGGSYNYTGNWNNNSTGITQIQGALLKVNGDAEIDGDLRVQGRGIHESLVKIEERLSILVPNNKLESEWEELAELRRKYIELEKKLLEQQQVFDILKKQ